MLTTFYILIVIVVSIEGTLLYYENCEQMYEEEDWHENWLDPGSTFSISQEHARDGESSFKFTMQEGTTLGTTSKCRPDSSCRSEIVLDYFDFEFETEYWIGYSVYIEEFIQPPWILFFQFHASPDQNNLTICDPEEDWRNPIQAFHVSQKDEDEGGSFYWDFTSRGDTHQCTRNKNYTDQSDYELPFKFNDWQDIVVHVRFSYENKGFYEVFIDGEKYIDESNMINAFNDVRPPYLKIGVYGSLELQDQLISVYYDEFRFGDSSSSYDEVKPRGIIKSKSDIISLAESNYINQMIFLVVVVLFLFVN